MYKVAINDSGIKGGFEISNKVCRFLQQRGDSRVIMSLTEPNRQPKIHCQGFHIENIKHLYELFAVDMPVNHKHSTVQ